MRTIRRQAKATSLDHAIELAKQHAKEQHRPSKVMADLMGVELKTYYRWLLENTLPLNRIPHAIARDKSTGGCYSGLGADSLRLYRQAFGYSAD